MEDMQDECYRYCVTESKRFRSDAFIAFFTAPEMNEVQAKAGVLGLRRVANSQSCASFR
jgi:hypothetical protein